MAGDPYRTSAAPLVLASDPQRSWLGRKWTRLKRLLRLFGRGTFKTRFPIKCDVCGKPSRSEGGGDTIHIQNTFEPCGHEFTFWRLLREHGAAGRSRRTLSEGSKNGYMDIEVEAVACTPGSGVVRSK